MTSALYIGLEFLTIFSAVWVSLCIMPVLALNSIPRTTLATLPVLGVTDVIGLALFVGGLSFEVTADRQKNAWVQAKKNKEHDEDFLTHGLWSKSRHPNYFVRSIEFRLRFTNVNKPIGRKHSLDRNCDYRSRSSHEQRGSSWHGSCRYGLRKVSRIRVVCYQSCVRHFPTFQGFRHPSQRAEIRQTLRGPKGLPKVEEGNSCFLP